VRLFQYLSFPLCKFEGGLADNQAAFSFYQKSFHNFSSTPSIMPEKNLCLIETWYAVRTSEQMFNQQGVIVLVLYISPMLVQTGVQTLTCLPNIALTAG